MKYYFTGIAIIVAAATIAGADLYNSRYLHYERGMLWVDTWRGSISILGHPVPKTDGNYEYLSHYSCDK